MRTFVNLDNFSLQQFRPELQGFITTSYNCGALICVLEMRRYCTPQDQQGSPRYQRQYSGGCWDNEGCDNGSSMYTRLFRWTITCLQCLIRLRRDRTRSHLVFLPFWIDLSSWQIWDNPDPYRQYCRSDLIHLKPIVVKFSVSRSCVPCAVRANCFNIHDSGVASAAEIGVVDDGTSHRYLRI